MNRRSFRIVAFVCIAAFAFTAIAAVPAFALLDAQIPVEDLFGAVPAWVPAVIPDVPVPAAPAVVDVHSPRPPPLFQHA